MLVDFLKNMFSNVFLPQNDEDKYLDKDDPLNQLKVVYGEKKSKQILKKISNFKKQNPGKHFSFIFDEHGDFVALEKTIVKSTVRRKEEL